MSSQGVTHFLEDSSDFQPLDSFERDYFLFAQTKRLRLFRQFRMWKAFKVGLVYYFACLCVCVCVHVLHTLCSLSSLCVLFTILRL